ncbi:MAG: membrane protein insertase YidC [Bdellovibrionaceae bacterium]|nr:membrane protein insertase YidC [Pseudobdellovibrionaceae bacterium]
MNHDDENQKGNGFFDKNTIIAVVLSFAVFFGWQMFMAKKYPPAPVVATASTVVPPTDSKNSPVSSPTVSDVNGTKEAASPDAAKTQTEAKKVVQQTLIYSTEKMEVQFVNSGFGIQKILLKEFSDREEKIIEYDSAKLAELLMATQINGQNEFDIRKISETEYEGTLVSQGMRATKRIIIDPALYTLKTNIKVQFDEAQKLQMENSFGGVIEKVDKTLFLPAYEHQELFIGTPETVKREFLQLDTPLAPHDYGVAPIAAFNGQYFALAAINASDITPTVATVSDGKVAKMKVTYQTAEPKPEYDINYNFYFGPKKMELLTAVHEPLTELIDYGMFAIIGRPLLAIMKVIFSIFGNWGIAIILLTILVKTVLFPLHMYSIKSMKKMQKIQPRLKELKEKYKNDPARMNQETLSLMKQEKANPLSGCLPALMQIPIFIALYSMLGKSFELYKEPFFLWIHDLSTKDPYFVLPILAGSVFFIQQKLTPTVGMDPAQAKVMLFMPVMITAFMLTVPSGLALYMFVNALFSVFQQLIVMREKTT